MSRRKLTTVEARRGRRSREKGHDWERELVHLFRAALTGLVEKDSIKRGLGQARSKGEVSDVVGVPHLWIEAKRSTAARGVNLKAAMVQAISDESKHPGDALIPVVVAKETGEVPVVLVPLPEFVEMYAAWLRGRVGV